MAARRNALGRGLGALIPGPEEGSGSGASGESAPATAAGVAPEAAPSQGGPAELPVEAIRPNPHQPRRHFGEAELERLADSVRRHGVLQPVVVRAAEEGYELVVGERRWRASKRAGLERIPALVAEVAAPELLEMALVENVQRHDLNPIELALAFRALADAGATQDAIGERVGVDRSSVANHLRLLELPRELQEDVESGALGLGHAKTLLQVSNPERRRHLRDRIVQGGLTVRGAEELARSLSGTRRPSRKRPRSREEPSDPNLRGLVEQLRDHLKTRVRITGSGSRGRLEVEFYGPEDLHRIARAILEGA